MIDCPIQRIIRSRYVKRLLDLADTYDDASYEAASMGQQKRSDYERYWEERTRMYADFVAAEPLRRAFARAA